MKFLRLPLVRYDVLDRPLGKSLLYWGLGSSAGYLNRSEPFFTPATGEAGFLSASFHADHDRGMEFLS